jgi:hypothetical protein
MGQSECTSSFIQFKWGWGIAPICQTTDFYPRIHRWESVSRRAVWWPRWYGDVAYTIYDNLLFLDARLEMWCVTTARIVNDKQ